MYGHKQLSVQLVCHDFHGTSYAKAFHKILLNRRKSHGLHISYCSISMMLPLLREYLTAQSIKQFQVLNLNLLSRN